MGLTTVTLTTVNTEFKGYFNDPALVVEGFNTYGIVHETYALTRVIYFVMTGKLILKKLRIRIYEILLRED